jgi:class 3 adenylate cyclase
MINAYAGFLSHFFVVNTSHRSKYPIILTCGAAFVCFLLVKCINGDGGSSDALLGAALVVGLLAILMLSLRNMARIERLSFVIKDRYTSEVAATTRILNNLLTEWVVHEIKTSPRGKLKATEFEVVCLYSDLKGFTELATTLELSLLVTLLDRLFSRFDDLVERGELHKMDTVGDAYIVMAGLQNGDGSESTAEARRKLGRNAKKTIDCGLTMIKTLKNIRTEFGFDMHIRIGVDVGMVAGGVIGKVRARHHIFGKVLGISNKLQEHAQQDTIHISRQLVPLVDEYFVLQQSVFEASPRQDRYHGFEHRSGKQQDVVESHPESIKRKSNAVNNARDESARPALEGSKVVVGPKGGEVKVTFSSVEDGNAANGGYKDESSLGSLRGFFGVREREREKRGGWMMEA